MSSTAEPAGYLTADGRGQWFVIAVGQGDVAQRNGRWIKTQDAVTVEDHA